MLKFHKMCDSFKDEISWRNLKIYYLKKFQWNEKLLRSRAAQLIIINFDHDISNSD